MGWARTRDAKQTAVPVVADDDAVAGEDPFWGSLLGDAARARMRGDRFFQVEIDHDTLARHTEATSRRPRRSNGATDLLGQIEELGWSLEHVAWWPARGSSTQLGMRGVYLFRASGEVEVETTPEVEASPVSQSPSHRLDVAL